MSARLFPTPAPAPSSQRHAAKFHAARALMRHFGVGRSLDFTLDVATDFADRFAGGQWGVGVAVGDAWGAYVAGVGGMERMTTWHALMRATRDRATI